MADKKPTHVAVHSIQYHQDNVAVDLKPGDEFVGSDVGDAKEIKRLMDMVAIKTTKAAQAEADAAAEAAGGSAGTGSNTGRQS